MTTFAAILAGGTGSRMGHHQPKQFLELAGRPLIVRTVDTMLSSGLFAEILVVIHPEWLAHLKNVLSRWPETASSLHIIPGGASRQGSSWAAIDWCRHRPQPPDNILIHDAARCLVDRPLLERCLQALAEHPAVTAAIPMVDSVARIDADLIVDVPPRDTLVRIQTPQAFHLPLIATAHEAARERGIDDATDDAQLVLAIDEPVRIVPGSDRNIKLSTPTDLEIARRILGDVI